MLQHQTEKEEKLDPKKMKTIHIEHVKTMIKMFDTQCTNMKKEDETS